MTTATGEGYRIGGIEHFGKTPKELWKAGAFPEGVASLLEVRRAYVNPSDPLRLDVHSNFCRGEWVADFVETGKAQPLAGGFLRVVYVQRPEDISASLRSGGKYAAVGGKRITYDCPPDGWGVAKDGILWHPETGAAVATTKNRAAAKRENATYIADHPDEFRWTIPEQWHEEFRKLFPDFNPEEPTPKQLAELETSYYYSANADTGVRAVDRCFWNRGVGPFSVNLRGDLTFKLDRLGARVRSKVA